MIHSAFCSPEVCVSEHLKRDMDLLLTECGIEKYKALFYEPIAFALKCNSANGSQGQPSLTPVLQERIRVLAPPEEDRRKIDDFLSRMSSILCQCYTNQ